MPRAAVPPPRIVVLTDREMTILDLVSRPGGTRKEAAAILGVNRHTVDHHMSVIFCKLGVDNVAAAARLLGRSERHTAFTPLPK